jgi:NAD-dependent dihydropyrimidine dehydrogenase PreA subunit
MPKPVMDCRKCKVCQECVKTCPMEVFARQDDKVVVTREGECVGCRACEVACPNEAIKVQD